ncbi:hypothetical protein CBM2587_U10021 [Cupriavidus taiwanensis]|uniref:Uncharacterized protein n=1 Tax=Cupriavidus taiwanensis TaxID=164546 RepID=A0A375CKK3_9BURK|nr:hypothetical protein CBM2587_U10021 [Cupriavidus taiwanensis]
MDLAIRGSSDGGAGGSNREGSSNQGSVNRLHGISPESMFVSL